MGKRYKVAIVISIFLIIIVVGTIIVIGNGRTNEAQSTEVAFQEQEEIENSEVIENEVVEENTNNELIKEVDETVAEVKGEKQEGKKEEKQETKTTTTTNSKSSSSNKSQSTETKSNSNSSNNNPSKTSTPTKQETPKVEEKQPERCTNVNNHGGIGLGNSGKWFSTKADAIAEYTSKIKYWGEKWESFEIDTETYDKNCPSGYEVWDCHFCGKWTINYYYR